MSTKLNDKDLKMISNSCARDAELGMLVPHVLDMNIVKKENTCIETLEKTLKSTTRLGL